MTVIDLFPEQMQVMTGSEAITMESSERLKNLRFEMAETCPRPRKVTSETRQLAEILKMAAQAKKL